MLDDFIRQALIAIINYNQGLDMVFDKKFLELQDKFELEIVGIDDNTIRITSKMKKD